MCDGPEATAGFVNGATGPLEVGSRVQTEWTREEGGDGRWYPATVQKCYESGEVYLLYDDGDTWKGSGKYVYDLNAALPPLGGPAQAGPPAPQKNVPPPSAATKAAGNEPTCPICLTNQMNVAFGCGHRICSECYPNIQRTGKCPICKDPIQTAMPIYN